MAKALIFYNSALEQNIVSMYEAWYKYEKVLGYSTTIKDITGLSGANIITYIETLTQDSYTRIAVCSETYATTATSKMFRDGLASLRQLLITASKGTLIRTGVCQSNSTGTIIIADSGASAVTDAYKTLSSAGIFIEVFVTAVPAGARKGRAVTGYAGDTKICTVATTSTAITSTDSFAAFTHTHVDIIGDAVSYKLASRVAWTTLFPSTQVPMFISLLGGYGSGYQCCRNLVKNASAITSTVVTTDTGVFTLNEFTGGDFYIAAETATTGAGQIAKITSNTADAITHDAWGYLPTGTLGYSIWQGRQFVLYNKYLPLAIRTYLWDSAIHENLNTFAQMIDRYGDLVANPLAVQTFQDLATLDDLAAKGKCVFDADNLSVV